MIILILHPARVTETLEHLFILYFVVCRRCKKTAKIAHFFITGNKKQGIFYGVSKHCGDENKKKENRLTTQIWRNILHKGSFAHVAFT